MGKGNSDLQAGGNANLIMLLHTVTVTPHAILNQVNSRTFALHVTILPVFNVSAGSYLSRFKNTPSASGTL